MRDNIALILSERLLRNKRLFHRKIIESYFIIIILLFNIITPKKIIVILHSQYSYITIKINGTGYFKVYSNYKNNEWNSHNFPHPNEIHINGINQSSISYSYKLNQTENIIKLIWNDNIKNIFSTSYMFRDCYNITEIDLSNFDTTNVYWMDYMFDNCYELTSINFTNINTFRVTDMANMFWNCKSLTSINLENFATSKVKNMTGMFRGCLSLFNLNLKNFDTSLVTNIGYMFSGCSSLYELDLSNFNTSSVVNLNGIFQNCLSLTSLDISNLDTSRITEMNFMFENCTSLTKFDLSKSSGVSIKNMYSTFKGCSSLTSLNLKNFNTPFLEEMSEAFYGCSNLTSLDLSYLRPIHTRYKYVPIENAFVGCSSLLFINLANFYFYNLFRTNMFEGCLNLQLINFENTNWFSNYERQEQYKEMIKKITEVNPNTVMCGDSKMFQNDEPLCKIELYCIAHIFPRNLSNTKYMCMSQCLIDYNNYENSDNYSCPNFTIKLDSNNMDYSYIDNKYYNNDNALENNTFTLDIIRKNILSNKYNLTQIDIGKDLEIIEQSKLLITITSTYNQLNIKENINKTTIDLMDCDSKLRHIYNITNDSSLYILKIDVKEEGMKIPKIEYEIYSHSSLGKNNISQLNLSFCKNTKVDISIPIILNDTLDKYDKNSIYYNDICSTTTSKIGTDISLKDRKNEFIDNNMTICEENCIIKNYDNKLKKVKCSCEIKINIPLIDEIKFDKDELLKRFKDISTIANIKLLKCFKSVFKPNSIIKNYGFYIFAFIHITFYICIALFYFKFYDILIKQIKQIVFSKKYMNALMKKRKKIKGKKKIINDSQNFPPKNKKIKHCNKKKKIINKEKQNMIKIPFNLENEITNGKKDNKFFDVKKSQEKIMKYNDNELNELSYKKALKFDKRTFIQYYFALLKVNHLLIFSFYWNNQDYNSQIIKIFLFFFFFIVHFTINALFFTDETLHNIYIDKGQYNFVYQIPQIIYSSLISDIINVIIKYLSLTENNIIKFKRESTMIDKEKLRLKKIINIIKIKFAGFFIITFIFLIVFAFYIICFCGVYINTQIHLIKDSLVSFSLSLVYPFGIYLIPSGIRLISLRAKKKDLNFIYKLSQILQNIF